MKLSADRKVTPIAAWKPAKKMWEPKVKNAFGLPAGPETCVGLTPFCDSCYVIPIARMYPSADALLHHNLDLLKATRKVDEKVALLQGAVDTFKQQCLKNEIEDEEFRIHYSGDFWSWQYTVAWAKTCRKNPETSFWTYTRSFQYVGALADVANLTVYLSVDIYNAEAAKETKEKYPWVKLAFCGETWEETEKVAAHFPDERKGPKCPELTKRLPMVNDQGVGACIACGLCIKGVNNVRFSIKR